MKRGGQKGNNNAAKAKDWEGALRRVLATLELKDKESGEVTIHRGEALRKIAETCVIQAIAGDKDARQEIANRIDGKPTEYVHIDQDLTVHVGDSLALAPALGKALELRTKPTVQ